MEFLPSLRVLHPKTAAAESSPPSTAIRFALFLLVFLRAGVRACNRKPDPALLDSGWRAAGSGGAIDTSHRPIPGIGRERLPLGANAPVRCRGEAHRPATESVSDARRLQADR